MSAKYCNDPDACEYSDCPTAFCDRKNKSELAAMPCSAWIDFRTEKPDMEETVLMWFPGIGGTGERGPWVKCDKLRNCLVGGCAYWAHINPPNKKISGEA